MINTSAAAVQLRLGPDLDDEVVLHLQRLIDAAIQRAADWLDRPLYQASAMPSPPPPRALEMTPAIESAILILVTRAYDERQGSEDETELGLPREVHSLLAPYRWFGTAV